VCHGSKVALVNASHPGPNRLPLAFTLIELLCVVMVIGLLAALASPSLSRARRAAKAAQCRNNVRQLILALKFYVDDYNCFPAFSDPTLLERTVWPDALAPFLDGTLAGGRSRPGRDSLFTCPALGRAAASEMFKGISYGYVDRGYAFQGLGEKLALTTRGWASVAVSESEVAQPSDNYAIGDGIARLESGLLSHPGISLERWRRYDPVPVSGSGGIRWTELQRRDDMVQRLHLGRVNVGFCDGHVTAERLQWVFYDTSDDALRRWNRDHEPHREWLDE
jgi:prepilin-type processing-associated H-X9-DG protein/prepilin-type N-terminal cleavage/methylation domain-containing protein